jgi:hypothetical protein
MALAVVSCWATERGDVGSTVVPAVEVRVDAGRIDCAVLGNAEQCYARRSGKSMCGARLSYMRWSGCSYDSARAVGEGGRVSQRLVHQAVGGMCGLSLPISHALIQLRL